MASGTYNLGSAGKLEGQIVWSSSSNGSASNTSQVTATLQVRRTDGYTTKGTWNFSMIIDNQEYADSQSSLSVGSGWVTLISKTKTVAHDNGGYCDCYLEGEIHGPSGTSQAGVVVSGGKYVSLDRIPRYASISQSLNSTGLNYAKINWSSDSTCDLVQYSLNGGGWVNASGNPYTISGLSPNTTYKVKTRVRRKDSQLYSNTGDLSLTTKDIGRISSVANFNHGSGTSIGITNPSGAGLTLVMKIGNVQIFSRAVTTSTTWIPFSEAELDNIYKRYGSSNSLTATFILTTSGGYTNSRTCTISLKGDQKTIKTRVSGTWRRGKVWIKVSGTWRRCVVWVKINGVWRRCI